MLNSRNLSKILSELSGVKELRVEKLMRIRFCLQRRLPKAKTKKWKTRRFHFNSQRTVRTPKISSSWSVSTSLSMTAGKMTNIDYGFQNKQRWCHREWQPWRRTKSSFWLLSQKCFDTRQWFWLNINLFTSSANFAKSKGNKKIRE